MANSGVYLQESLANKFLEMIKAGKARIGASGDPLAEIPFASLKRTRRTSEQVLNFLHIACKDGLNVSLGEGGREQQAS
ncbi:uncharacterized protein A1O9_10041 [Exophiala aquamarina CBS 119918]|uniref:Uncharacterized protein n=1 Tax=Exophiala aquamarina CBS 119918 TaxID=1182545 RepID=A0A072P1D3_9EURO|nr:uncharacterized protein A1O9_10041 [Exophiala aquamarina CBS 119918]KEF53641.1 hypothetical protein A1O9_10041 [Exophiala aquamarina CBS 119918]